MDCSGCCGARNERKGTKGAGRRPEKEETGQGMHGRMRRVTGYPTATLILRESERVLIRISFLHRLDRTIRIRGRCAGDYCALCIRTLHLSQH